MGISININKTLDDLVTVKKVSILWFDLVLYVQESLTSYHQEKVLTDQNERTQMKIGNKCTQIKNK